MERYRYYTTSRPPVPGGIPKEGLIQVCDFGKRVLVPSINGFAWGYADYNRPLVRAEIYEYELVGPRFAEEE
ncbi:MAG: hypothetical protein J6J78_08965 [Clostridia bacterium]|nr:hypothetical protein [Clostridia bacterium]